MTLEDTIAELGQTAGTMKLPDLRRLVLDLRPGEGEVEPFVRFTDDRYARNLVHRSEKFETLVLCWKPGQRSPIHDHADSLCAVYVHDGVMSNDSYLRTPAGHVRPDVAEDGGRGTVFSIQKDEMHQVSNLDSSKHLVSIHFYLTPLENFKVYSLMSSKWETYDVPYNRVFSFGGGI